jgi:hypothetical protein
MNDHPAGRSPQEVGQFAPGPLAPRPPLPGPHPHEAAYCGLAAVPLLMAAPALQLAFWLEATGYKGFSPADEKLAAWGGYLAALAFFLLSLAAVRYAGRGIAAARRTGEPQALCDAGIYMGLVSALVWVGVGVAWHSQAWRFIRPG